MLSCAVVTFKQARVSLPRAAVCCIFLFLLLLSVILFYCLRLFSDNPRALPLLGGGRGRGVQGERRCHRPRPPEAGDWFVTDLAWPGHGPRMAWSRATCDIAWPALLFLSGAIFTGTCSDITSTSCSCTAWPLFRGEQKLVSHSLSPFERAPHFWVRMCS